MPVARYDPETQRRLLDLQAFDTQIATAKQRLAQLKKDPDYQQGKNQYEKFTDQLQHLNRQRGTLVSAWLKHSQPKNPLTGG